MLGYILEKTSALVSELYDGTAAVGNYVYEDIASIPDAITKGWNEGLTSSTSTYEQKLDEVVAKYTDTDGI